MKALTKNIFTFFILSGLVMACQPADSPVEDDMEAADTTATTSKLVVEQDITQVDPEKVYTYMFLEDPKEPMADVPSVEKPAVNPADVVEKTLGEKTKLRKGLDRPPLFSRDCLAADSARACSNKYLAAYVEEYIEKKEFDAKTPSPLMYISFIITKDGDIQKGSIRVDEKNSICKDCVQLAEEIVRDMPDWIPGMKDGKLRRTAIKFPVHFKENKNS